MITFPIAKSYVADWTVEDAKRELLQNAMDTKNWYIDKSTNALISTGTISRRHWLMGVSEKTDAIGKFGEGLKLAALVLAREGYTLEILSGNTSYKARLEYSEEWQDDILVIDEEAADTDNITTVLVTPQVEWSVLPDHNICRILPHEKKLYVRGLYVCDLPHFMHGYNVDPKEITLGRDRNAVSDFDTAYVASKYIAKYFSAKEQLELLKNPDVQDAMYLHCFEVKEELVSLLRNSVPSSYINGRTALREIAMKAGLALNPSQQKLSTWLEANKKHMRSKARRSFVQLIKGF